MRHDVRNASPFQASKHDRFRFLEPSLRFRVIDAESLVVIDVIGGAAAETHDQPAFRYMVDEGDLFRHADRVVQCHLRDREADLRVLCGGRQRCGELIGST